MDKIAKFLKILNQKEKEAVLLVMLQIKKDFTKIPGFSKLIGYKNLFRIRVGRYRLIFKITKKETEIVRITKRDENTYKNL